MKITYYYLCFCGIHKFSNFLFFIFFLEVGSNVILQFILRHCKIVKKNIVQSFI
jgi:hypothetical protein